MIYKLRLQNFRNLLDDVWEFSPRVTTIIGPNASGKTNLLEAIYLLSTGKSFKANLEIEMIGNGKEFARIKGLVEEKQKLEVVLSKVQHKKFLVGGVAKRLADFTGNLKVVLFAPQDLDLVTSSPSLRRRFLDNVLSQTDREYRRALLSYEKGLRARNKLLFRIREENLPRTQLVFWNQLLIKNGDFLSKKREEFVNFVNFQESIVDGDFLIYYDKSAISEARLEKYAQAEIGAATTLVGPHRDDFIFKEKERDLASFGSRGEQRMAVLWLKLGELAFIEDQTNEKPTLLLDDIFSELDEKHRKLVSEVALLQQTIITTADPQFVVDIKEGQHIQF